MNLQNLTGKKNNALTSSGNKAIWKALEIAKSKGYSKLFIPDMGGWYTYDQYGKKLGFEIEWIKTDLGLIDFTNLKDGIVLFHTMPAYAFNQEYDYEKLKEKNVFVIADICGDVGIRVREADIVVCSFGALKPVNAGYGGVIWTSLEINLESDFDNDNLDVVEKALKNLPHRIQFLKDKRKEILKKVENVIRSESGAYNIIVKEDIKEFCEKNLLPYRECPMKIRVNIPATSIEIKALQEKSL